jgi:phenylacetate-CoA ligase
MKSVSLRGDLNSIQKECFDPYTNTLYLSSFCLNEQNADWYYEKIASFQPNAIYGYPSSLEILCNLFKGMDKQLQINLVFTSSETLHDFQREKIQKTLSARIFDWYGNAERTIALQENFSGMYQEVPLYSFNEFNKNDLYATSLINDAYPLIRYRVDDVIDHFQTETSYTMITGIQGRKDDYLEFVDGRKIGRMSGALKGVNHLKYAQFVQDTPENFILKIVADDQFCKEDENQLREKVKSKVGDVPFQILFVDEHEIVKTKAGKFKLILNNFVKNRKSNAIDDPE